MPIKYKAEKMAPNVRYGRGELVRRISLEVAETDLLMTPSFVHIHNECFVYNAAVLAWT